MTDRAKTSAGGPAGGAAGAPGADEFAHIPRARTRHPLVAAAGALLAFFLVFHIRHDLRYALSSGEPLELGDARVTFAPRITVSGLENRDVRVRGTPDRESGLELDTKGSWVFSQLFRVLGTGDRLYVHRPESPLPAARAEEDVFEGRLIQFKDLSFASSIRAYFSAHVTATHFFAVGDLRRGLAAGAAAPAVSLKDLAGDSVTLGPNDVLAVDVLRPDEVRVALPRGRFPTQDAARAAIEQRAGQVLAAAGLEREEPPASAAASGPLALASTAETVQRWAFVARFPAARRDSALSELGELDRRVQIRDARETVRVHLSELADGGDALVVTPAGAAARRLPDATIATLRTLATVQIADDAYLLIEADHPRDHLATVFMGLLLVMFGAVNLVALFRELRR